MNINEICNKIRDEPEYNFLRDNPHLGSNIIMLGLGGSYAYGTNTESSDLDIRGIATRTRHNIHLFELFFIGTSTSIPLLPPRATHDLFLCFPYN